jgi:hypothetical protein
VGRVITTMSGGIGPLGLNLVRIRPRPPGTPPPAPGAPPPHNPPTPFEVIGVVQDVRNAPFGQPVEPAIYFTTRQFTFREQFVAVKAVNRAAAVAALVLRQSAVLIVAGLAAGIVVVRLAEGVLARVVFGVTTSDAAALVTASGVLLLAALVACVPPALRAMRVDPVEGLRAE